MKDVRINGDRLWNGLATAAHSTKVNTLTGSAAPVVLTDHIGNDLYRAPMCPKAHY